MGEMWPACSRGVAEVWPRLRRALASVSQPKAGQAYFDASKYGIDQIDTPEHQQLAYEAALQSVVLLKNEKHTLPLKRGLKLALVGPHVDGHEVFISNGHCFFLLTSTSYSLLLTSCF